jgi:hypothetical protein
MTEEKEVVTKGPENKIGKHTHLSSIKPFNSSSFSPFYLLLPPFPTLLLLLSYPLVAPEIRSAVISLGGGAWAYHTVSGRSDSYQEVKLSHAFY